MSAIETITYSVTDALVPSAYDLGSIRRLLNKAAGEWNRVFADVVVFREVSHNGDIRIQFGRVDRSKDVTRVAQCMDFPGKRWNIVFASDRHWAISWWHRFLGKGEDFLAVASHEFGHILDLLHSDDPRDVMHSPPGGWRISDDEASTYRKQFFGENPV